MNGPGSVPAPASPGRGRRRLFTLAGVLAGLLLLAVVLLPLLASTEGVRAEAERRATSALGRPVTIRSIRMGLLTGPSITLGGLKVSNPSGFQGDLCAIREIGLNLALSSLWSRRVTVDALRVTGADIRLVRRGDGRMNLASAGTERSGTAQSALLAAASAPLLLQVDRIVLEDLKVSLEDQAAGKSIQSEGISLDARVSELPLELGQSLLTILQHTALEGALRVASVRTEGLALEGLHCRLLLDAGLARLDGGEALLNTGPLRFQATADLQDADLPAFTLQADLEHSRVTPECVRFWMSPLLPAKGEIVQARLEMAWKGTSRPEAVASLAGRGDLTLTAEIDVAPLLPREIPIPIPPELARFSRAWIHVTVGAGMAQNAIRLEADGSAADLSGTTRLSDLESDYRLSCSGKLGGWIPKWIPMPIPLRGPLTRLRPDLVGILGGDILDMLKDKLTP